MKTMDRGMARKIRFRYYAFYIFNIIMWVSAMFLLMGFAMLFASGGVEERMKSALIVLNLSLPALAMAVSIAAPSHHWVFDLRGKDDLHFQWVHIHRKSSRRYKDEESRLMLRWMIEYRGYTDILESEPYHEV